MSDRDYIAALNREVMVLGADNERLREALRDAVALARLFNRDGMTWLEYDRELVRLEGIADVGFAKAKRLLDALGGGQ